MFDLALRAFKFPKVLFVWLCLIWSVSTVCSAPTSNANKDKYCGVFREQSVGEVDTIKVAHSGTGLYRFQIHGSYSTAFGGNFGDIDCTSKITNNLAVIKKKNWKNSGIWILFKGEKILVVQEGSSTDLELGNNVNLTGIYRRTSNKTAQTKFPSPPVNLKSVHFEKSDGTLAFNGTFEDAQPFHEERAVVTNRGKKGFIDLRGRLIIPYRFDGASNFKEGLAAVSIDGKKWGYIDNNGNFTIKPIYDDASDFCEGHGAVAIGKKFFWIDNDGAKDTDKSWDQVIIVSKDFASVRKGDLWGLVDKRGDEVLPIKYVKPVIFKEGLAVFQDQNNMQGYIDTSGKEVIAPAFDRADAFSEGLATVGNHGRLGFIDKTGAKVISDQFGEVFGSFSKGKCLVRRIGSPYISVIDKAGKQLLELPLQVRNVKGSDAASLRLTAQVLDFNMDSSSHTTALNKNYEPMPAFANKEVKACSESELFVVYGPSSLVKAKH